MLTSLTTWYLELAAPKGRACQLGWNYWARSIHMFQSQSLEWFIFLLSSYVFCKECLANLSSVEFHYFTLTF